jgi:hypothetical protein
LGYRRNEDGSHERDPAEAALVFQVFWNVAEGLSARETADELDLPREQVRRILHRREYAWGDVPLVTTELWERAHEQLVLLNPRRNVDEGRRH